MGRRAVGDEVKRESGRLRIQRFRQKQKDAQNPDQEAESSTMGTNPSAATLSESHSIPAGGSASEANVHNTTTIDTTTTDKTSLHGPLTAIPEAVAINEKRSQPPRSEEALQLIEPELFGDLSLQEYVQLHCYLRCHASHLKATCLNRHLFNLLQSGFPYKIHH